MDFKVYNTLHRQLENFKPINAPNVGMYTCGPTVYNFAHIGNFRAYLFEDFLCRALTYYGYKVTQVMNLTDVDDKTIRDSQKAGVPLRQYTQVYKDAFFEDLKSLNINFAAHYPAATDHINEMIEIIQTLMDKGFAYQAEDNSIYFSITKFSGYGKLAKIDMENQRNGVRINSDEYEKESVADFALWKAWDKNDGDVVWDSPWGKGRPGWHIECSAMSMKYLGKTFDIHTGGVDNMFPHHEDEIAQSEAANGCQFVHYWLHNEHLIVNGTKMSKSLGNFYTVRDLLAQGWTGKEIRWCLLSAHYRKKLNFSLEMLGKIRQLSNRFLDFFQRLNECQGDDKLPAETDRYIQQSLEKFKESVGDDLNISEALATMFNALTEFNKRLINKDLGIDGANKVLKMFQEYDQVLGFLPLDLIKSSAVPQEIQLLAEERQLARKNKDFKRSDEIRDLLKSQGWTIEDTSNGPRVKKM